LKRRFRTVWFAVIMLAVLAIAAAAITFTAGNGKQAAPAGGMVVPSLTDLLAQRDVVNVKWVVEKYAISDAAVLLSYETRNKIETCGCSPFQLGGIAPRMNIIKAIREKMPVLVLDAGGVGDGDDSFNLLKMQTVLASMKIAGYDGVNVGVQEMLLPPAMLLDYFDKAGVPLYSANVFAKGAQARQPDAVRDFALASPPKDGFTPLAPPGFRIKLLGRDLGIVFLQFTQLTKAPKAHPDYFIGDPKAAYEEIIRAAGAQAPKQWILVAEGYQPPIEEFAAKHPEIILVLSGNMHISEDANAPRQISTGAYWLNTFLWGKYLGIVNVDGSGFSQRLRFNGTNIPILSTYAPDPQVYDLIKKDLHSRFKEIFREQSFEYKAANIIPPEDCKDCHAEAYAKFAAGGHTKSLETLKAKGEEFNVDCLACHVVYDYTNDTMYGLQCISCHQEINPKHGFSRQAGLPDKLTPTAKPTYEFCVRCHTPEQSAPFKKGFKRYLEALKHWK
jgi:2',3'-cyclic-nucleotide 2'-phosphodiesterase (5'-nucleotidase family)